MKRPDSNSRVGSFFLCGLSILPFTKIKRIAQCIALRYTYFVIISFQHKGLERFFRTGKAGGIQPHHVAKLRLVLGALNEAIDTTQLNIPGWRLHALKGDLKGFWSITINGNWRVIFRFVGHDVELLNYLDYH